MADKNKYFIFDNQVWKLITKRPRLKDMTLEQQTIMNDIKKQHLIVWKALNCGTNEILLCAGVPKDTKLYKSEKWALRTLHYKEPKEITDCKTNGEAREKLARFVLQIRYFKEQDLTRMQNYLQQFYVIETNPKIADVIDDMHTLIRFIKGFLYGTK